MVMTISVVLCIYLKYTVRSMNTTNKVKQNVRVDIKPEATTVQSYLS